MDRTLWDELYKEADELLKNTAIAEAAESLSTDLVWQSECRTLARQFSRKGRRLASRLVPCTHCGALPVEYCQTETGLDLRYVHATREARAELKGFLPKMYVHVHAENREYKGADEINGQS
ncbi:MAG: hypothetical protein ABSG46_20465 [Candidatus Binataceae bacterium]|jgi:hypothetical protein